MYGSVHLGATTLRFRGTGGSDHHRPPVLLLHPWFGCQAMWRPFAARLDRATLAVDWYSLSRGNWDPWATPHGLARAALALLDREGIARADVIGNSVGGIVTQILAAEHPERVRRIVLVGTGAHLSGPPSPFGELVGRWIGEPDARTELADLLVDALVAGGIAEPARREYVDAVRAADPDFITAVLDAARVLDLRPQLGNISAPTLVLRGEHDAARTHEHAAELVRSIPDAAAAEMPDCGHSPMIEDVDRFTELVCAHLDR